MKFKSGSDSGDDVDRRYSELLKFLFLTSKYPQLRGTFIPVSQRVDDLWHEAILQTRYYQKLCQSLPGGEFIHHESMSFDHYAERKPKDVLIDEILRWLTLYVENFGAFQSDRLPYWFFISKVKSVLNISLDDLNQYANSISEEDARRPEMSMKELLDDRIHVKH